MAELTEEERAEFLRDMASPNPPQTAHPGRLRNSSFDHLLHHRGTGAARLDPAARNRVPQAAGKIHTDMERGLFAPR